MPKYAVNKYGTAWEAVLPFQPCTGGECTDKNCPYTMDAKGTAVFIDVAGDWLPLLWKDYNTESGKDICDCGAAAADYAISRIGGPGHSDWCKVSGKEITT